MSDESPRAPRSALKRASALAARYPVLPLVLLSLLLVKSYFARLLATTSHGLSAALVLEAAAFVTILGGVDLIGKRRSNVLDITAYALLSVFMLANALYAQMFGAPLDPRMLGFAGQVGEVQASVFDMVRRTHVALIADIPVWYAVACLLARGRRSAPVVTRERMWQALVVGVAAVVLAVQVGGVLSLSPDADPITVVQRRGLFAQQIATLVRIPFTAAPSSAAPSTSGTATTDPAFQAEIEAVRNANEGSRTAGFAPGAYKGSNVIVIQVESLIGAAVGTKLEGKPITPNLDKLSAESWYFPNTFSQTSAGNTSDAEFSENTGLLAPANGAAAVKYADKVLPALPRLLRADGYTAVTMHANYVRFWNRDQLYPALGFTKWYDHAYFGDQDEMWHASDQVLFAKGMKALDPLRTAGTPFYAQFITMTSHHPFKYPLQESRRPLKLSASAARTYLGRYAGAVSYTDFAIGEFIDALKANGLYDTSIIVVYGDHAGPRESNYGDADRELMRQMIGRPFDLVDRQRVPLIVHLPGQTSAVASKGVMGQVDIMPTLADALGLDITAVPHVGKSGFVTSPGLVQTRAYLPAGTTITDRALFVPGLTPAEDKAYDLESGAPVRATDADRAAYERARKLTELSDSWIGRLPRRADASTVNETGF